MVLVLFLAIIIVVFIITLFISKLQINIKELELSNEIDNSPIIKKFDMVISIYIFKKLKIFSKNINKQDLQNAKNSKKLENIKSKFVSKDTRKEKKQDLKMNIDIIKKIQPKLKEIELNIKLGTEDVLLTSFLIGIISIVVSIVLARVIEKYDENKYKYKIIPNYNNKNSIKITLKGIIDIKLVNIITVLIKLLFRSGEFDKRASNRRSYANSYE